MKNIYLTYICVIIVKNITTCLGGSIDKSSTWNVGKSGFLGILEFQLKCHFLHNNFFTVFQERDITDPY